MKLCSRCKQPKDRSQFGVRKDSADGLNYRCKPCNVAVATESRQRHPETSREWETANLAQRRKQKAAAAQRIRARRQQQEAS